MKFQDLLTNPAGKGSSQIASRQSIIRDLAQRYAQMKTDKKRFSHALYRHSEGLLFHIRVPSETFPAGSMWYDVLLLISLSEDSPNTRKKLMESSVKFWSNSPAFFYTYLYAAQTSGSIIDWPWLKAYTPKSFLQKPEIRNPDAVMGFEKSLHWAMLYLLENSLQDTERYIFKDIKFELQYLKKDVRTFDEIMRVYDINKKKMTDLAQKKREKEKAEKKKETEKKKPASRGLTGKQSKVKKVSSSSSIRTTRKVRKIKGN